MAAQCDYNGERARRVVQDILAVFWKKAYRDTGCTQKEIAAELGISVGTASRYLSYMVGAKLAHIAHGAKWRNGAVSGATYKPGLDPAAPAAPARTRRVYSDIPLAFFGVKQTMNTMTQKPLPLLSPWFKAVDYRPGIQPGPYQCRQLIDGFVHFRWYDHNMGWSKPLPYDPDLDDKIERPGTQGFIGWNPDILDTFEWQGYNEDQEEL